MGAAEGGAWDSSHLKVKGSVSWDCGVFSSSRAYLDHTAVRLMSVLVSKFFLVLLTSLTTLGSAVHLVQLSLSADSGFTLPTPFLL